MSSTGITTRVLALLVQILLGAVALALACWWKPQKGKSLFCIFVGTAFLLEPLIEVAAYSALASPAFRSNYALWNTGVRNDQRLYLFVIQCVTWSNLSLYLVSGILLVVYAAIRRDVAGALIDGASESNPSIASSSAGRWDTKLTPHQRVNVARRREWAHAIDCLPALLLFVFILWVFGSTIGHGGRDLQAVLSLLCVMTTLFFLAYLLMKDCVGGVSLGKWLTGCRVVDATTGFPASVPQTMLRNVIYLLFPFGSLTELAVANFRADRKRLGDLWAGTMVVHGPANMIDGERVKEGSSSGRTEQAPKKHPLDD